MSTLPPKISIKYYHACKCFDLCDRLWYWHAHDDLHLGSLWFDTRLAYNIAQIIDLRLRQKLFVDIELHSCFLKFNQHFLYSVQTLYIAPLYDD